MTTPQNIRVAFWHNVFSPYRVPLFQQLAAFDDIDLTVYYGSMKDAYRAWHVEFGEGYRYGVLPSVSLPGYPYKFNYTLINELRRHRYDVCIAVENEIGCQLAYIASRLTKTPLILWSIEIDYEIIRDPQERTLASYLKRLPGFLKRKLPQIAYAPFTHGAAYVKRHADAYLVAGAATERHLRNAGATGECFRFGNTIDTEKFAQRLSQQSPNALKQQLGIEKKRVILSVSYLQKRKGIQYLIKAFLQLPVPDSVLMIVGDGEYKTELLKLLPNDRHDILWIGHDEDTSKYYAMADIFVMPSFSDPWGLTVNEAMLAGLPVIATTNIGAKELIQGNGFLIPPRDASAMKEALERLLLDEPLRKTMGVRSREIIKDYTISHSAEVCRQAIYAVQKRRKI
ncbi:hypothetical protein U14_02583 [Candidatus Moduliflexus flocculans]|uniref:Glycosyl transferase family 1 domain-containing protein n=1 Tax=Candidatus Moduliflexus flocculans TaxID=1499966 RepID=A0A081BLS4_9BACT|nr:hypothetical protein U14_02583 [Candidatus Moduliflexus flocculans]